MALRYHDKGRSSWTLIGLAVRIAHGLGIHRDGDGQVHSAFEAEMRRRLLWEIIILSCNLNDSNFNPGSVHPLPERKGITDMTFFLINADLSNTALRIKLCAPLPKNTNS